jgi:hypothetical protein
VIKCSASALPVPYSAMRCLSIFFATSVSEICFWAVAQLVGLGRMNPCPSFCNDRRKPRSANGPNPRRILETRYFGSRYWRDR